MSNPGDLTYRQLVSRNAGFLNQGEQERIKRSHVAVLGLGLGAIIAELLVRTGFNRLTLIDGDAVAIHNLNRQPWLRSDLGRLKARVMEERLRAISPRLRLTIHNQILKPQALPRVIGDTPFIIDAIGVEDLRMTVALHRFARREGNTVLEPMNLGWGGGVFIFAPKGITFEHMIGLAEDANLDDLAEDPAKMLPHWAMLCREYLPEYLREPFAQFLEGVRTKGWCDIPQLGVGIYLTAAITVQALVRLVLEKPTKLAPELISWDPWAASMLVARDKE